MKIIITTITLVFYFNLKSLAADLIFANTIYYTSIDSSAALGTALTSSGTTLAGFDFGVAPSSHPIFHGGVFFPVTDCENNNLWVRLRHVAADPNGNSNGQNINSSTGPMFYAGPGVLGGLMAFFTFWKFSVIKTLQEQELTFWVRSIQPQ